MRTKNRQLDLLKTQSLRMTSAFVILAGLTAMFLMPLVQAASYRTSVQAYGMDTVAGYEALLSVSHADPGGDVTVAVGKPDGSTVRIPVKADSKGNSRVNLYDYHTRKSGVYSVMAYSASRVAQGAVSSFSVYADELSLQKSEVVAQTGIARASGTDNIAVRATLKDQYGNGVQGRQVNLISSRSGDTVVRSGNGMTDKTGTVWFMVSSSSPGVSIFSAIDVANGDVLNSRAQVAFLAGDEYIADAGGDFNLIPKAFAQSAGPLHHFEISGIPSNIQANQNVSFRVTAQDQNDITVENYTGTVRFSAGGANSANVTLPEDYLFKAEDLGTHEFSLGLKFTQSGTYTLEVRDTNNTLIAGETTVVVGSSGAGSSGSNSGNSNQKPSIVTPVSGTYSQNVQTVSGSAPSGTMVRIFDNDQEIGSVQVGANGSYSYQTAPFTDGDHSIYVTTSNAQGTVLQTSETVKISIDTTPPSVDEVTFSPMSGIKTGNIMTVRVLSEPNLSEAALVFNSEIFALAPSLEQSGMYTTTLQAPANPGEYPLDVLLVDALGNEATYQDEALITITSDGTGQVSQNGEENPEVTPVETPEEQPSGNAPTQVFGVIAFGSDKRVTLIWEAATDDGTIDHYKIYYGTDPLNLGSVVETKDAATTWYVPDLENGREYYFGVAAVDNEGFESLEMSELVNAIPFTLEIQSEIPERPSTELGSDLQDPILRGAARDQIPPEMVDNGPELVWLLFGSGAASGIAGRLSRRKKKKMQC